MFKELFLEKTDKDLLINSLSSYKDITDTGKGVLKYKGEYISDLEKVLKKFFKSWGFKKITPNQTDGEVWENEDTIISLTDFNDTILITVHSK